MTASMQRTVLFLTPWHVETIEQRAHKLGITKSDYTRRWLDSVAPPDVIDRE